MTTMLMAERMVTRAANDPLRRLVVALSALDLDHATERNATGWSATHTGLGHALAVTEPWSPAARRMAWEMVGHYRRQATLLGVDVDAIEEPLDPGENELADENRRLCSLVDGMELAEDDEGQLVLREAPAGTIALAPGQWVIRSGYDAVPVASLRQLRGARWDAGERVWRVPAHTDLIDQLVEMAEAHRLVVVDADGKRVTDTRNALESTATTPPPEPPTKAAAGTARLTGTTWTVSTEYDPALVEIIRSAPGRRWDRDSQRWTIPDSAPGREALRRLEAAGVRVAWPKPAAASEPIGTGTGIPRRTVEEVAGLTTELRPWQREAVIRIVSDRGGWLLADDMGLGKSLTALTVVRAEHHQRVVVLCPRSLRSVWVAQADAHFTEGWTPFLPAGRQATPIPADATMVVAHYDVAAAWQQAIIAWAPDALVLDESHAVKSAKAARSRAAADIADAVRGRGGRVLLLSGTPAPNHPSDLLHQLRLAGRLAQLGGWQRMAEATGLERGRWGWEQVAVSPQRSARLRDELTASCMIRRTRAEVAGDLVPLDPVVATLDLPRPALAEYRSAEAALVKYLREHAASIAAASCGDPRRAMIEAERALEAAPHLVSIAVLRRLVGEVKAAAAVEYVRELLGDDGGVDTVLDGGEPTRVLVFAHHRDVLRRLGTALDAPVIDGETPEDDRARLVAEYQAGEHRVLVLGLGVGGEGLTLTAANIVLHAEWGWTAAAHQQAEARAARLGQTRPVTSHYLVAPDTIDEAVAGVVAGKAAWGAALMATGTPTEPADDAGGNLGHVALAALLARASTAGVDEQHSRLGARPGQRGCTALPPVGARGQCANSVASRQGTRRCQGLIPGTQTTRRMAVDEVVLEKVRKLLAKAESCSNFGTAEGNHEAEALMAKAQQMIAEHAITEAMLSTRRNDNTKPEARVVKVHPPYAADKAGLLGSVGTRNRTRAVITKRAQGKEPMEVTLVGFSDDLDATEMMFTSLLMQMVNEMLAHPFEVRTVGGYVVPGGSKETQRRNYMAGYVNRVGERLDEASRAAEQTVQQTETSSVALVLLDRKTQVAAAYHEMFPNASRMRRSTIGDQNAYAAGRSAGSRADLGQQRVAPRRALPR